jgi:hypothetical protein
MKTGIELIAEERQRQIDAESYTPEHDDEHDSGELAGAGACYALSTVFSENGMIRILDRFWPWDVQDWKPTKPIRDLVKAGALIAAEIDRLQRASDPEA